jgi:hypothetical protein
MAWRKGEVECQRTNGSNRRREQAHPAAREGEKRPWREVDKGRWLGVEGFHKSKTC